MAQTIEQLLAGGDITIGALDSKSRIAPVTRNGKPVLITLSASPTLTTSNVYTRCMSVNLPAWATAPRQ